MRIRFLDISVRLAIFALARHTGLPVINNYLNTISQIAVHRSEGRRGGAMDLTSRNFSISLLFAERDVQFFTARSHKAGKQTEVS